MSEQTTSRPSHDDLLSLLEEELARTLRRARELSGPMVDSEEELSRAEWCYTVLEKLSHLPAGDLETVDGLCAALLDPADGRAREAAVDVVGRLFEETTP